MNPKYLWLADAIQLMTFFVLMPAIAIVVAYTAWRREPTNLSSKPYWVVCVVSSVTAFLLLVLAKWIDADIRTPQYFLQLACFLLGFLLFGVAVGAFLAVLLRAWYWHKKTRLATGSRTEHNGY